MADASASAKNTVPTLRRSNRLKSLKRRRSPFTESLSSTSLEDLPDPLIVEILIRLPCKSCFKCKSVSKRWLSLISQPYFIRQFISRRVDSNQSLLDEYVDADPRKKKKKVEENQNGFYGIVWNSCKMVLSDRNFITKASGFSLTFLPCFRPGETEETDSGFVVASSLDLLLCCSTEYYQNDYYICNPLTQQWIQLPNAPCRIKHTTVGFIAEPIYDFSGEEGIVNLNLGFRYKVIRFCLPHHSMRSDSRVIVSIFSSEIGKWSEYFMPDDPNFCFSSYHSFYDIEDIFVNCGMLHWWSSRKSGIVSFDPLKKRLCFTKKPEDMRHGRMVHIGSCKGRTRICELSSVDVSSVDLCTLSIWELEDFDSGKWQSVHKVCIKDMVSINPRLANRVKSTNPPGFRVLIHPDDKDLVYLSLDECFVLCNIHKMTAAYIGLLDSGYDDSEDVFPFQVQLWPSAVF